MCGVSLVTVTDPMVGKTIAQRYRVIDRLGGGGMASVYLARHVMIERLSAVKVLRGDLSGSAGQRDRFLREARAVNRINHENIVEITDFGEWDTLIYMVMEYIPGEPLQKHLLGGPLSWQRAASIGAQLAGALGRAHQMGVVHRDLKPGNVLLVTREVGEVAMLTDFGIAKILDAPPLTLTSQICGTPGYIAPEYVEGKEADARSDLYALGVVLYECVTGKLPHDEASSVPLLLQVMRDPPRPLSSHPVAVPRGFDALVMQLLSRQPEDRPRDAFEAFDRLAELLLGEGLTAAGPLRLGGRAAAHRMRLDTLSDAEASSRPFAHLALLCAQGLSKVEAAIAQSEVACAALPARTRESLEHARSLATDVAVASHAVTVDQGRIAELERYGRTLRASLGRALDELSRDLTRVVGHRDEARERLLAARQTPADAPASARLRERAMLEQESLRVGALAADLEGQVQALRDHLATQNETLEKMLSLSRDALEGRVGALRRLGAEAWAAIDEVGRAVGTQPLPTTTLIIRPSERAL